MDIYQSMPSIAAMQEQSAKRKRGDDDEEQAGASADQAVVVRTIPETYAAMHCEEDGVGLTTVVAVAEEVPQTDNSSQRDREAAELLLFLPGAPEAPDSGAEGRAGAGAGSSSSAPLPSTRMLPRASAADVAAAIGGRASGKLVAAPEPTPGGAHPWLRLLACEHEYNLPDYPLALANATATSGDAGHVYLTMSMRDPKDEAVVVRPSEPMRLHAALLVETNDERWPTLHMLPPSHLAHYWSEQHRQKCFTYLCNPRGQPAGLAGWNTFMKADFPQSLPDGACPGTWTHVEGRKIALMPYPWTVSSGAYERNQKWNTLGGREFRVLVYAEDMVRFPHAVCTTEPFRILKRSTLNNNKGKVVDMKPKFTLPLGPMRPPEPPARVEKDGPPKGKAAVAKLESALSKLVSAQKVKEIEAATKEGLYMAADRAANEDPQLRARALESKRAAIQAADAVAKLKIKVDLKMEELKIAREEAELPLRLEGAAASQDSADLEV